MANPAVERTDRAMGSRIAWWALSALSRVFVVCLVVQFFLVGLDVFEAIGESELHRDFAYTYGWLTPILVLLAALAGTPRRTQLLTVVLLVLYAIQTYLPLIAERAPLLSAFHSVNALVVVWVAVQLARAVPWNPAAAGTGDA